MTDFEMKVDQDIQVWYKAIRRLNGLPVRDGSVRRSLVHDSSRFHIDEKEWKDMWPEEKARVYYFYWKEMLS